LVIKDLKWNLDNFDFYYEGELSKNFSYLNSEIYNKKFQDLIDNDKILCYNYNIVKDKWEWLSKNRITFQKLIDTELEIIYNEIKKGIEVFDFFSWYLDNTGKCYINLIDDKILEYQNEIDSIIFIENLNGEIIGILQPDGTVADYNPEVYGTPATNDNSIVLTVSTTESNISGITEPAFCGEEVIMEEKEYDFC